MDGGAKQMSNTQRAVEELRRLIFSGELGAGSDHLESELADRLGMSRTPVREAAMLLAAQGLVEMRPRKGLRVLALAPDDMRDIYEVLTELESLSAENAARMGYSDADLSKLTQAINDMDDALEHENLEAWALADDQFHAELVWLGKNSRVQSIAAMMVDQVRRARALTLQFRPLPLKSNQDHRGVLEAIRSGDALKARQLHHAHRTDAKGILLGILEKYRLRHL
ncbi:GntR family transcriptional regulator [Sedimentitalea todarodis]|uniref:GntR family transcriptional regulator n=1 Tax=Sedimentitalea todarodis TaxID=1631240 RepID=A0ABU3VA89_9RHOB|nr:GntR family transcriptional regulator [Sedimentitalea todarodis]MDU9003090.1 GntR family transcriptional regulator [Sedimentitalea todarodis]